MESCKIQIHNKNNFGLSPQEIQLVFLNMISLSSVFWDATPCSLVNIYRLFGGTCCSIFRKMKAVHSCKNSIFLYRTTRRHTLSWGSQHTIPFAHRVSKLLTDLLVSKYLTKVYFRNQNPQAENTAEEVIDLPRLTAKTALQNETQCQASIHNG